MKRQAKITWAALMSLVLAGCSVLPGTTTAGSSGTTSASSTTAGPGPISTDAPATSSITTTSVTTAAPATIPAATTAMTTTASSTSTAYSTAQTVPSPNDAAAFYPSFESVMADLDGDGTEEKIYYDINQLLINGEDLSWVLGEDVFDFEPHHEHLIIADIDAADPARQIVIITTGPSEDYALHFYSYADGRLIELGDAPIFIEELATTFDGAGHIYGTRPLTVLQTWFAPARWKLEDGQVTLDPYDLYYPFAPSDLPPVVLKVELPIYEHRGDDSPSGTMLPQAVQFIATDNEEWVQIEAGDGTSGWFKVTGDHIVDLDKDAREVFDNLFSAG